jgi:hypothetical protein
LLPGILLGAMGNALGTFLGFAVGKDGGVTPGDRAPRHLAVDSTTFPSLSIQTSQLMCQRVKCSVCGKPSWVGCGLHVEQVLGDVPVADRCQCQENGEDSKLDGGTAPPWWKFTGRS